VRALAGPDCRFPVRRQQAAPRTPSWKQGHLPSDRVGPRLDPLPVGSGRGEPASRIALGARPPAGDGRGHRAGRRPVSDWLGGAGAANRVWYLHHAALPAVAGGMPTVFPSPQRRDGPRRSRQPHKPAPPATRHKAQADASSAAALGARALTTPSRGRPRGHLDKGPGDLGAPARIRGAWGIP